MNGILERRQSRVHSEVYVWVVHYAHPDAPISAGEGRKIDSAIMTGESRNVDYLRVTCERFESWVRATTMSGLPAYPGAPSAEGDHATF